MIKHIAIGLLIGSMCSIAVAATVPVGNYEAGKLMAETVCGACHGADGNSSVAANPRIAGQNAKYLYKQLHDFKSGARVNAIMALQVATMTDQDMANVAEYFSRQSGKVSLSDPKTTAAGQKLFMGGDRSRGIVPCAGCHGPAGLGNRFAAFPRIGGQHAEYIKQQLMAFRAAGRNDLSLATKRQNDSKNKDKKGMMQHIASKLSDQDIEHLANYITGIN